jgi:hypothetical protein
MLDLNLPEEITASRLRGEDPEAVVAVLEHVLTVTQNRHLDMADRGLRKWDGHGTVVVVAPSSEVLGDIDAVHLLEGLARFGRVSGISLRLVDVVPPLREADENGPALYSLAVCGSPALRAFINAGDVPTVTLHQVSPREMMELAENA